MARVWMASHVSTGLATGSDATLRRICGRAFRRDRQGLAVVRGPKLDGDIAAMLAFRTHDNYLDQLFVAPEHQGKGIGKALLAFTAAASAQRDSAADGRRQRQGHRLVRARGLRARERGDAGGMVGATVYYRWRAAKR
ncbi:MAG: GNAT family N-acetyltransferase [Rhizomicrobium sp.]